MGKLVDSDIYVVDDTMLLKYFERKSTKMVTTININIMSICNAL
ncbi:hypothetical protein [Bacillus sp. 16GRE42]|nr:hypothetical protein [Bacillus sp. 16GRE42]